MKSRWKETLIRVYPELVKTLEGVKNKEIATKVCLDFSEKIRNQHLEEMVKSKSEIETDWSKISDRFLRALSDHFETDWSTDRPLINCYMSILPVFPRFLDKYSFCISWRRPREMREVIAHEILHFLWFKKWKEVFPESNRSEFESSHLVWRLSEIMDPIILQCYPEIKELIKPMKWGYQSFSNIKIGEVAMTPYFAGIYMDCLKRGDSFQAILEKCFVEVKKHREAIEKF
jgi:hypothetical protein